MNLSTKYEWFRDWFRTGFVYFPGGVQKQRILSSFVAFSVCFAQHGRK